MPESAMPMRAALAMLVAAIFGVGCRAAEGEACGKDGDCRDELRCHEQTCMTPRQIALIRYQQGEAAWRDKRKAIVGKVDELDKRMDELEKQLSGAESDAQRDQLKKQLDELRRAKETAEVPNPVVPGP